MLFLEGGTQREFARLGHVGLPDKNLPFRSEDYGQYPAQRERPRSDLYSKFVWGSLEIAIERKPYAEPFQQTTREIDKRAKKHTLQTGHKKTARTSTSTTAGSPRFTSYEKAAKYSNFQK